MVELVVYHTQEKRDRVLSFPILANGHHQWFGDGYYFWEDEEFANDWGLIKKCGKRNKNEFYSVYKATLTYDEDEMIDTVFNENDYKNFVSIIEKFADQYFKVYNKRPSIFTFNEFISDHNIWHNIKVIRFQDVTSTARLFKVQGFAYKKRIQIRVNDPEKITNFAHFFDGNCN